MRVSNLVLPHPCRQSPTANAWTLLADCVHHVMLAEPPKPSVTKLDHDAVVAAR